MDRRKFIAGAALAGGMAVAAPFRGHATTGGTQEDHPGYADLDQVLKMPVLKRELFPYPVIIDKLELLQDRNNFICRVRSSDGAEGISIGHPFISKNSFPMFRNLCQPVFTGKDARDLDSLIFSVVEGSVKNQGIPLCVQVATVEFAILDMLGTMAGKPAGMLIGEIHHPEIAIYLGTRLSELRRMEPEVSLDLVMQDYLETKARAIKIRAGKGDNLGADNENAPGRTEKLIRMAREKFGDKMVLMIDGNGTYSVKEAIRIGKILEEYRYYFYEEPVPWDWYEEQKQVADALRIPMAGGEEEFGMHAYRWLIGNNAFDIFQPDLFYNGGMIRSMQVARMAAARGKTIVPHLSEGGLGYLYLLHYTSACKNAGEYHEFKMFATKDANGTTVPVESKTEPFSSRDGIVKVPQGPGLGITIDQEYIKTHKQIF